MVVALEGTGVVLEVGLQVRAQGGEVGGEDTGDVAAHGLAAGVRGERGARLGDRVVLIAQEEEELVLDDRAREKRAVLVEVEGAGVEGVGAGLLADEAVVALPDVGRTLERVRSATGDGVDGGAHEVALAHVIGSHVDLHLLDRGHGDGGDAGSVAGSGAETEGVVEVRAVDRDVVQAVVGAAEGEVLAAGLRGESDERVDAVGLGRKGRDGLATHGRGRSGARRAEHGEGLGGDCDFLGQGLGFERELEVGGTTQAHKDSSGHLGLEAGHGCGDGVGAADPHARDGEASVGARHGLIFRSGGNMDGHDRGPGQNAPGFIDGCPVDGACGYLSGGEAGKAHHHRHGQREDAPRPADTDFDIPHFGFLYFPLTG